MKCRRVFRLTSSIIVLALAIHGHVGVAVEPDSALPDRGGAMPALAANELAVSSVGRMTVAVEGSGAGRSVVFRDRTAGYHELRIRIDDGLASFDGNQLPADETTFVAAMSAARATPGDLSVASLVTLNPVFHDAQKRATMLAMLEHLKSIVPSATSDSTYGRRAQISWNCVFNAVGWGTAIFASWGAWTAECGSGVLIAACIAEVGALTTVTTVGAGDWEGLRLMSP